MAKNRTCFICGNKYDYCPNCDRDRMKPSWYTLFCSETCHAINDVLSRNTCGDLSIDEANKELKNIAFNINDINNDIVKKHIRKIMNYKKETQKVKQNVSFKE